MNQPRHAPSRPRLLLLLVLTGALGACGDESSEPGLLLLDRDAYDFGQHPVGERSDERVFTVRNAGPAELDGLGVRIEPADAFDVVGTTCAGRIEPSETCTITVAFTPVRGGAAAADLVVEADGAGASAALAGLGAFTVRVVNNVAGSAVVESMPAGIRCGAVCEATFAVPEIVLTAAAEGVAVWSEPCAITPEGHCALALEGSAVITLQDILGEQWRFGAGAYNALAIDAGDNVIATGNESPSLFQLSPAGALAWQQDELGGGLAVAVDAQGNVGFIDFGYSVRKLDSAGNALWRVFGSDIGLSQLVDLAFDPSGALLVAGTQGGFGDEVVLLVKLDVDGNVLWSQTHDAGLSHLVEDLAVDGAGNAIISGYATSAPAPTEYDLAFVRKYDPDGAFQWEVAGLAGALTTDAAGNVFVDAQPRLHKYAPDGALLWDVSLGDILSEISTLAVTPAGDVIAAGTRYTDTGAPRLWVAQFGGTDGARRRPFELPSEVTVSPLVAVDGNGDVVVADSQGGFGIRKYDGALFDQPDGSAE